MTVDEIIKIAKECGFDEVNILDPKTMVFNKMVRDTCETDKCGAYGKNWGCPPHGDPGEDIAKLQSYEHGLILQCIGRSEKRIDRKMYFETGKRLADAIAKFKKELIKENPNCLVLGAGGCSVCSKCARPEPCRFPEKRIEALEGYGIFITQLCRDNNVLYYYGEGTIAYNGAALW
jgi:predicted metal-binding protein